MNNTRVFNKWSITSLGAIIVIAAIYSLWFFYRNGELSSSTDVWAQYAVFVGGLAIPVVLTFSLSGWLALMSERQRFRARGVLLNRLETSIRDMLLNESAPIDPNLTIDVVGYVLTSNSYGSLSLAEKGTFILRLGSLLGDKEVRSPLYPKLRLLVIGELTSLRTTSARGRDARSIK